MDADAHQRLSKLEQALQNLARVLTVMADQMRIHGEQVGTIIEILTPEETDEGANLETLLRILIAKLDGQSLHLAQISQGIRKVIGEPGNQGLTGDRQPDRGGANPE